MIETLQGSGSTAMPGWSGAAAISPPPSCWKSASTAWLISIFEGRIVVGDAGPVRDAVVVLCAARVRGGMAEILEQPAAAGLQRPDGADQAARAEGRGQPAGLHGAICATSRKRSPSCARGSRRMSAKFEPIIGRYMHLDLFGRPHRIYVEEAGEGTPLLCLHTAGSDGRQYRAPDERCAGHGKAPRHRLRHALARQVVAAGRLARRGVPAHLGAIHHA